MNKLIPELLAPAGSMKSMKYALDFGADAVYAGHPRYSLRARNNDFTMENLEKCINYVHSRDKKIYITSNIFPHNNKVKTYLDHMGEVALMKPDAFIMADPGLIMMAREAWPDIPIHLSVQANTINFASVNFWKSVGVSRVILSRELTLKEIAEIREQCPDMEIEVFVHGALCISYSGRCLLSGYFNKRDANQGTCANSCRWKYKLYESDDVELDGDVEATAIEDDSGKTKSLVKSQFALEEQERQGQLMAISEDEHGTYILNSKDLRAVQYINQLSDIGVDSVKIEGRTKSHYYVARATQVYRKALDDAKEGRPFDEDLLIELDGLANREYTEGFFDGYKPSAMQNYETGNSHTRRQKFIGEIIGEEVIDGKIFVEVKNRFTVGDNVELITSAGNISFDIVSIETEDGDPMEAAPGSGYQVYIKLPEEFSGSIKRALLVKNLLR